MRYAPQISMMALALCVMAFTICACAKREDGRYDINLGTITESLRTGKLVVNEDDITGSFTKPSKPRDGCILLVGTLQSDDPYDCATGLEFNASPNSSSAGKRGLVFEEEGNNNWFSVEINKESGDILNARLSFSGYAGRGTDISGNLDQKLNGSFGHITANSYAITVSGQHERISPGFGETVPEQIGPIGAVIMGRGDLLKAINGTTFKGKLYLGVDAIPSKTPSKRNCDADITFGTATFKVIR